MTNRDDNEPIRSNPGDFWQKKGEELREMFSEKKYTEKEFEALRSESQAKDTRIRELEKDYAECLKMYEDKIKKHCNDDKLWTDEQVTKLVGNWMGELLLTHLKDNIHGKVNLTELAAKFHEYKNSALCTK